MMDFIRSASAHLTLLAAGQGQEEWLGGSGSGDLMAMAVYLLIIALVISLAYLVPRLLGTRFGPTARGRRMRVVEVLPVGRDRAIILLEVAGRYLLIGSTPQSLSHLASFSDAEALEQLREADPSAGGPGDESAAVDPFRRVLHRFLEKGQK